MLTQFFTVGLLILFSAMLPGPDFALVTKNTLLHSRRAGIFTSFGIASAILIHITYCVFGLAIVISQSILIFNLIKFIGSAYLIFLGVSSFFSKKPALIAGEKKKTHKKNMSDLIAFRQGFLCNALNPKASLFFLALFTVIIKPSTPLHWELFYAIEMVIIIATWFCSLTLFLSHPLIIRYLNRLEQYLGKIVGVFLIGFGVALAFVQP